MLAYILAIAVGLGSLSLYMAAFFFPEVHRKDDFLWSGVGLFYALVLWFCAGRITGGVLLGQAAGVALLLSFGWQTLKLRRAIAHPEEKTALEEFSLAEWLQKRLAKVNPWGKKTPTPSVAKTTVPAAIEPPPVVEEETVTTPPSETVPEATIEQPTEVIEPSIPEAPETIATKPDSEITGETDTVSKNTPETEKFTPKSFSLTKLASISNIFRRQKPKSTPIPPKPETIAEEWDVTETPVETTFIQPDIDTEANEDETLIEAFKPKIDSSNAEEEVTDSPEIIESTTIITELPASETTQAEQSVEETTSEAEITPPSEPFAEEFAEEDEIEQNLSDFLDDLETNTDKPDNSSQSTQST